MTQKQAVISKLSTGNNLIFSTIDRQKINRVCWGLLWEYWCYCRKMPATKKQVSLKPLEPTRHTAGLFGWLIPEAIIDTGKWSAKQTVSDQGDLHGKYSHQDCSKGCPSKYRCNRWEFVKSQPRNAKTLNARDSEMECARECKSSRGKCNAASTEIVSLNHSETVIPCSMVGAKFTNNSF